MGTHPKSPSHVFSSGKILSEHLASHPELIGKRVIDKFDASNGNLPFLFKVLSIHKALSIQSHPDKATAETLHAQQPDIYKGAYIDHFSLVDLTNYCRPQPQTRNGPRHHTFPGHVRLPAVPRHRRRPSKYSRTGSPYPKFHCPILSLV